jgi:hypothetical protein
MIDGGYEFVEIKVHLDQEWPESVVALKNSRCNANDFALFERFDFHGGFLRTTSGLNGHKGAINSLKQ